MFGRATITLGIGPHFLVSLRLRLGHRRLKFSAIFLRHLVRWLSLDMHRKFHGGRPRGTPSPGEINTREVAKYSDFGPIEGYLGNGAR